MPQKLPGPDPARAPHPARVDGDPEAGGSGGEAADVIWVEVEDGGGDGGGVVVEGEDVCLGGEVLEPDFTEAGGGGGVDARTGRSGGDGKLEGERFDEDSDEWARFHLVSVRFYGFLECCGRRWRET